MKKDGMIWTDHRNRWTVAEHKLWDNKQRMSKDDNEIVLREHCREEHMDWTLDREPNKEMSWCSKVDTNPCELEIWRDKQDSSRMPRTQMFAYSNLSAIELESKEHWKYIGKHCNDAGWFCKVLWPDCEGRRGQSQIVDAWETKGGQPETEVPKTMGNNWMEFEEAADSIAEWWEIEPWADGDNWTHRKHLRRLEYKDKQLSMWLGC